MCSLITIFAVVTGQFIVARVLNFGTNLSVIINFVRRNIFYISTYERKESEVNDRS